MHLSWPADERPAWRVRSVYVKREVAEAGEAGEAGERLDAAVELEEALRASGKVCQPWVTLDGTAVTVSGLVRADSEREAALDALELIESVCAMTGCWLLGDLVRQTIQPWLH